MDVPTRMLLTGLSAAVLLAVGAPPAAAHAAYKSSDPADGSTVAAPPSQITAEFTEPMTDSSYLEVYDPCGDRVDNGDSAVTGTGHTMSVTLSGEKAGEYTVEFAAQSVDTHVTYGSFSFTSSGGAACAGAEPPRQPTGGGGNGGGGGSGAGGGGPVPDPGAAAGTGTGAASGGSSGPAHGGVPGGSAARKPSGGAERSGGGRGQRASGTRTTTVDPVAFQGPRGKTPNEPNPWDLPVGGVVMALALCVMIGAAGGRVYAGIVAPPRD